MPIDVVADMCTENSHPWPWHDEWKSHRMWNRTGSLFELFVVDKKHIIYLVSAVFYSLFISCTSKQYVVLP